MKRLIGLSLFVATTAFGANQEVIRGLQNLGQIQIMANALEQQKAVGKPLKITGDLKDPWGTPYRLSINGTSYRIGSAGADRKFDDTTWSKPAQFRNMDEDVVFADGHFIRSNRNWLALQATEAEAPLLKNLRDVEMYFMIARHPSMALVSAAGVTMEAMKSVGSNIEQYRSSASAPPIDGWGTPMRLIFVENGYRLVSAGSDKEFQPDTWTTPIASSNPVEDMVYENGNLIRRFDAKAYLEKSPAITTSPIPQPIDPPLTTGGKYLPLAPDVTVPKVVTRVEPVYPESYRRARINGLVIVQLALSDTGAIEDVRVLRSLAPEADLAAITAARQWKFEPGTKAGKAVPVLFNLTFNFKLQ